MTDHLRSSNAARWVWVMAGAMFVLHQDFWWWDNQTLVFGFLPIGLAYHGLFSIAAGFLWAFAVRCAWPTKIEQWAEQDQETTSRSTT